MGESVTDRPELRICGHCCLQMQGYASAQGHWLCHTDDKSCYNAVTLHGHSMRCLVCDPVLAHSSTWDEVKARMARDWTDKQWAQWDAVMARAWLRYRNDVRRFRGIDRLRAMYRRRKR